MLGCGLLCRAFLETNASMAPDPRLITVLREARARLALAGNDFAWSSWKDAGAALAAIDKHLAALEQGQLPPRFELTLLFAPTGPIQEVSLSSGWGAEFLSLASRFDAAAEQAYG